MYSLSENFIDITTALTSIARRGLEVLAREFVRDVEEQYYRSHRFFEPEKFIDWVEGKPFREILDWHEANHYQAQFGVLSWLAARSPLHAFDASHLEWNISHALRERDPALGEKLEIGNVGGLFCLRRSC